MRKQLIMFAGVAVIAVASVIAYAAVTPKPVSQSSTPTASPSALVASSPEATTAGAYVDYRSGIVEVTTGTKILFFHAPWCSQCRKLEQSIKAGPIPGGVTIIKVDYDGNQALRKQYGITIQTTLVRVDDGGAVVKRYVAYDTPSLAAATDNLLD